MSEKITNFESKISLEIGKSNKVIMWTLLVSLNVIWTLPNNDCWHFHVLNILYRLEFFVNTLTEEMQKEDIIAVVEHSKRKSEIALKSELVRAILISMAKSRPE